MKNYDIQFSPAARREIKKIDRAQAERILKKIEKLSLNHLPSGVKRLKDREERFRIRIGDYRVIYSLMKKEKIVLILHIGHRREIFR